MDQIFRSVFSTFNVRIEYLIWYFVMFAIVLLILWRFAFGPVMRMIEGRQAEVNESLERAEEAAQSVKESSRKAEDILHEASLQSQEIIRRAERAAADLEEIAVQGAKNQAELLITRAKVEIDRERAAAIADIRTQVVDLAVAAAGRVIHVNLDAERNRKLVEEAIKEADIRA